jgi:NADH-quinone oxidoreductase subunit F
MTISPVSILSARFDVEDAHLLAVAREQGAYATLDTLFDMTPDDVTEEVKNSGLRGRGGAGFPAGIKWSFLPKDTGKPVYLTVNADESEPATFKDRYIIVRDPHLLIEGIIICCYAIGCHDAYIYIRGEYTSQYEILRSAVEEAYAAGYLGESVAGHDFSLQLTIHRGAGAYICGEETALLESIEGKKGQPRSKPPFSGGGRPLRVSHHYKQRPDHCLAAVYPCQRCGRVSGLRHRKKSRHPPVWYFRPCGATRNV